jgi:Fe-S-cluster containining protein
MSREQQLKELWQSYNTVLSAAVKGSGQAPKLKTEFVFKDPLQCFQCNIRNCLQCCCRNQGQKIRLLLQDLAVLLDNGQEDMIEGKYDSKAKIEAFLKKPSRKNVYKTPYLKRKSGKDGLEECVFLTEDLQCSVWDKAPFICKTYPLIMEQEMTPDKMLLTFSLDKQCSCTRPEEMAAPKPGEYTRRIINDVVCERIEADHTSKLLCYKRNELQKIGLGKYL